jgi:branched-chain amino acid transport system ATP-binding protein
LGLSLVPEGGKPFPDMTVQENLEIGAYMYQTWKNKEESLERVYRVFPVLKERTHQLAKTLSGGERQMLAMARSLMAQPKLCLFDEPVYGLAPIIVRQFFDFI